MQPPTSSEKYLAEKIVASEAATEPRLPTYEEATGQMDSCSLPSYKITRRMRFHPYSRYIAPVVDVAAPYYNTIYDESCDILNVPPFCPGKVMRIPPLIPETEEAARKRQNIARALEFERRVHRLQNVILDFVEGVRRAHGRARAAV